MRKDDKECYFSYYPNYAICSACAYMLKNCCDMDDEDISQNQMKFGCSIETLMENKFCSIDI